MIDKNHECFIALNNKLGAISNETFYKPISFSQSTGIITTDVWGIRVEYTKANGKRNLRQHVTLFVSYCPMCGKRLDDEIAKPENK